MLPTFRSISEIITRGPCPVRKPGASSVPWRTGHTFLLVEGRAHALIFLWRGKGTAGPETGSPCMLHTQRKGRFSFPFCVENRIVSKVVCAQVSFPQCPNDLCPFPINPSANAKSLALKPGAGKSLGVAPASLLFLPRLPLAHSSH